MQQLQAENIQLKDSRAKAGEQLQSFMNVVYKEFDVTPVKVGSQESLLDNRSHKSFASGTRSRASRQSMRSNSSCSSMSSVASSNILDHWGVSYVKQMNTNAGYLYSCLSVQQPLCWTPNFKLLYACGLCSLCTCPFISHISPPHPHPPLRGVPSILLPCYILFSWRVKLMM